MDPYAGGEPGNGGSGGGGDDHTSMWDWQAGGYYEPTDTSQDLPTFMWDCLNQDDNELLTLLENQTPLRDCGGFHSGLFDLGDITCKETLEESREPKRRRMLEYPPESDQPEVGNHGTSSTWAPSEATEVSLLCNDEPQSLNWGVQNNENNLDTVNTFSNGALYQPSHNHLENCCDEASMYLSHEHSNVHSDGQTDVSGTCEIAPVTESAIIQETNKLSTLKVFKGENSSIKVKKNLTTSVAYPFTLIKPSWDQGDVTLKDINQRIHAPPKKAPVVLGTSAFSGKPVIGKTRIRTEGGKGSITILRTKG